MDLEPCAHCGAPDAPSFCAACRAVRYCGAACQQSAWRDHKLRCIEAAKCYSGVREHDEGIGIPEELQNAVAKLPTGAALARVLRLAPPSARAGLVERLISALDVERVEAALTPAAGVPTTACANVGGALLSMLYCAARTMSSVPALLPELHDRALAVWEAVVDAAPLAQLNGTVDFPMSYSVPGEGVTQRGGTTPLCKTCSSCNRSLAPRAVAALLRRGVDVNGRDDDGLTPLLEAVQFQSVAVVRQLLAAGADATARESCFGFTALHYLASKECPATAAKVRLLVEAGADLEAADKYGCTPLRLAVESEFGSMRAFDALLEAGASTAPLSALLPNPHIGLCLTALHVATYDVNVAAVRRLLGLPLVAIAVDATAVAIGGGASDVVGCSDFGGATALHIAVMTDDADARLEFVRLLVDAGADTNARDGRGHTALTMALMRLAPLVVVKALVADFTGLRDDDLVVAATAACITSNSSLRPAALANASARTRKENTKVDGATLALLLTECARRRLGLPQYALRLLPLDLLPDGLRSELDALAHAAHRRERVCGVPWRRGLFALARWCTGGRHK
jgi:uncharacterized protein